MKLSGNRCNAGNFYGLVFRQKAELEFDPAGIILSGRLADNIFPDIQHPGSKVTF